MKRKEEYGFSLLSSSVSWYSWASGQAHQEYLIFKEDQLLVLSKCNLNKWMLMWFKKKKKKIIAPSSLKDWSHFKKCFLLSCQMECFLNALDRFHVSSWQTADGTSLQSGLAKRLDEWSRLTNFSRAVLLLCCISSFATSQLGVKGDC